MTTTAPAPPPIEAVPLLSRVPPELGGEQHIYRFDNGYGASIVRHSFSYGGTSGLWEIAVLKFEGPGPLDWRLNYDAPVTDDVIGHQTDVDVAEVLLRIAALPARAS